MARPSNENRSEQAACDGAVAPDGAASRAGLLPRARQAFPAGVRAWLLVAAGVALWAHVNLMFSASSAVAAQLPDPGSDVVWLATLLGNVCALLPAALSARSVPGAARRPFVSRPGWVVAACLMVLGGAALLLLVGEGVLPARLLWLAVFPGGVGEGLTLVFFAELFCGLTPQRVLCIAGFQQVLAVLPALALEGVALPALSGAMGVLVVVQTGILLFLGRDAGGAGADGAAAEGRPAAREGSRQAGAHERAESFPWGNDRAWAQVLVWAALVAGLCYGATVALTLTSSAGPELPMGNMLGAVVGGALLVGSAIAFTNKRSEEYLYQVAVPLLALGLAAIPLLTGGVPAALPILLAFSTYLFGLLWFFAVLLAAPDPHATGQAAARAFLCFFLGHLSGRALIAFAPAGLATAGTVSTVLLFAVVILLVAYISTRRKYERDIVARAERLDLTAGCDAVARTFGLTPREQEVFRLLVLGFSTKRIADKLVLSENSVNTHIRHIYSKLGIHGRDEVAGVLERMSGA